MTTCEKLLLYKSSQFWRGSVSFQGSRQLLNSSLRGKGARDFGRCNFAVPLIASFTPPCDRSSGAASKLEKQRTAGLWDLLVPRAVQSVHCPALHLKLCSRNLGALFSSEVPLTPPAPGPPQRTAASAILAAAALHGSAGALLCPQPGAGRDKRGHIEPANRQHDGSSHANAAEAGKHCQGVQTFIPCQPSLCSPAEGSAQALCWICVLKLAPSTPAPPCTATACSSPSCQSWAARLC